MIDYKIIGYVKNDSFKPCPFCGGEPVVEDREMFEQLQAEHDRASLVVHCDNCGASLNDYTFKITDYNERVRILATKWNTRYIGGLC